LKIHLAGAFGIDSILQYNNEKSISPSAFASYFPFKRILPDLALIAANDVLADPEAVLVVINLNQKTWDAIQPKFSEYKKTILIQFEARIGWELAYEIASLFDHFISFDRTQKIHPGFHQMFIPYNPHLASSGRDKRGYKAVLNQWKSSRKLFIDTYLFSAFPRKKKSVLIATLNPNDHYQIRKLLADKWSNYRGYVSSKVDILKRYRYCLVMENQRQNGYITEKLFDCLPSGAVPIYWGAQDIQDYLGLEWVPILKDETYHLNDLIEDEKLYKTLKSMLRINRKRIFETFSTEKFITMVCQVIKSCYQENS
jgi:hypothetical protein